MIKNTKSTGNFLVIDIFEFDYYLSFESCYLQFSAKKLVLECLYRVWQKITCQLLNIKTLSGLESLNFEF